MLTAPRTAAVKSSTATKIPKGRKSLKSKKLSDSSGKVKQNDASSDTNSEENKKEVASEKKISSPQKTEESLKEDSQKDSAGVLSEEENCSSPMKKDHSQKKVETPEKTSTPAAAANSVPKKTLVNPFAPKAGGTGDAGSNYNPGQTKYKPIEDAFWKRSEK